MGHQRAGPGRGRVTLRGDAQASRLAGGWQERAMRERAWTSDKPLKADASYPGRRKLGA